MKISTFESFSFSEKSTAEQMLPPHCPDFECIVFIILAVLLTLIPHVLFLRSGLRPNCLLIKVPTSFSHHVLLRDVTLHVAVGVFVLKELGEGGVLGVCVQSHHMIVVTPQLGQGHAVRLPGGNLIAQGQTDSTTINDCC